MSRFIRLLIAAMVAVLASSGLTHEAGSQTATGMVSVQKYYCTYLDETLLVEAIDVNECTPGAATFTFYLIGDGTADYQQLTVGANGQGSIELPVGSYEMVEEGTQTFFNLTVAAGQPTNLLIGNPAIELQPTAVPAQPTAVSAQPTAVPAGPIGLPNTGSGEGAGSGLLALALATAAAIATGGALAARRYRER